MPSISIFIPAYNAQKQLPSVIARIPGRLWKQIVSVWIINDGSTDNTARTAEELKTKYSKVHITGFSENMGYGRAVKKALQLINAQNQEYAVCLHADGQYAPECIPDFIKTAEENGYDILQGSRIAGGKALSGGMPLYKYLAGRVLTTIENAVFGLHMTDYHSGYMCYSRKAIHTIPFERLSDNFDFDLEVIASAVSRGLKIGEIPIPTRYADEESHLNPVAYGFRVLRVMAGYMRGKYA